MKTLITTTGFEKYACANNAWVLSKLNNIKFYKIILYYDNEEIKETNLKLLKELFPDTEIQTKEFTDINDYNLPEEGIVDISQGPKYVSYLAAKKGLKAYYIELKDSKNYKNKKITQIPIINFKIQEL